MMDNEEKFFSGIEDSLHAYEDAYKPGAWEAFQQRKRKRMAVLYYRIAGVAALLLLFSYAAVRFFAETPQTAQYTSNEPGLHPPKKAGEPVIVKPGPATQPREPRVIEKDNTLISTDNTFNNITSIANTPVNRSAQRTKDVQPATTSADPMISPTFAGQGNVMANNSSHTVNNSNTLPAQKTEVPVNLPGRTATDVLAANPVAQAPAQQVSPKRNAPVTRSIYDSLVNDRKQQVLAKVARKDSKPLTYSVVVQPGVGNQKVNFGTGVEVAYKLTDNISISSGVAYSSLNAATNGTGSPTASSARQVQGINLAVSGVEVPIGVQYKTNSGYYVSAGVVGMQVLSNNLQYNYIAQVTVPQATYSMAAGKEVDALRATTEAKTEDSREKIKNVLGFYMLSVGKKKAVGNNQLNFGPFMRIPFGAVSSENIRLMQAGVRVGFDF